MSFYSKCSRALTFENASRYGASQLPLFVFLKRGKKVDSLVGAQNTALRKKILKRQSVSPSRETSLLGTSPDSPPRERIGTAGSNSVKFLDTEKRDGSSLPSLPPWLGADSLGPRVGDATTPRALWRKQVRVWSLPVGVRLACWCGTGSLTLFSA